MDKQAVKFFVANAGYSYNPKTETKQQGRKRGAIQLATAERAAELAGAEYDWQPEQEPIEEFLDTSVGKGKYFRTESERDEYLDKYRDDCWFVVLRDGDGTIRASLGGIVGLTREYRRLVEAELALEAFGQEFFIQ